jgi:hypothetical protein
MLFLSELIVIIHINLIIQCLILVDHYYYFISLCLYEQKTVETRRSGVAIKLEDANIFYNLKLQINTFLRYILLFFIIVTEFIIIMENLMYDLKIKLVTCISAAI